MKSIFRTYKFESTGMSESSYYRTRQGSTFSFCGLCHSGSRSYLSSANRNYATMSINNNKIAALSISVKRIEE